MTTGTARRRLVCPSRLMTRPRRPEPGRSGRDWRGAVRAGSRGRGETGEMALAVRRRYDLPAATESVLGREVIHVGLTVPRMSRLARVACPRCRAVVLAGCTAGSAKTATHHTPAVTSRSSAAATDSGARLIQPPGPVSARPALLAEARAACRKAKAPDITLCAGTIDAEVWGLPLVTVSQLRDTLACLSSVNVLDSATKLDGPDSTAVPYPNDDTLYSTAFLDLRAGPSSSQLALDRADATSISSCSTCTPTRSLTWAC